LKRAREGLGYASLSSSSVVRLSRQIFEAPLDQQSDHPCRSGRGASGKQWGGACSGGLPLISPGQRFRVALMPTRSTSVKPPDAASSCVGHPGIALGTRAECLCFAQPPACRRMQRSLESIAAPADAQPGKRHKRFVRAAAVSAPKPKPPVSLPQLLERWPWELRTFAHSSS